MGKRFLTLLALCALVPALLLGVLYLATRVEGEVERLPMPASTELYAVSCSLADGTALSFQATSYQYAHSVGRTFRTEDGKKVETTYDCIVVQLK